MEQGNRTPDRPTDRDTGTDPAERIRRDRRAAACVPPRVGYAGYAGYAAVLVWPLACLALYTWQLIGIAGG
jgi:hypothetical protein